ncbi:TPA: hypothetical protein ACH3X1_002967 [Trebouxia sp. C0004]
MKPCVGSNTTTYRMSGCTLQHSRCSTCLLRSSRASSDQQQCCSASQRTVLMLKTRMSLTARSTRSVTCSDSTRQTQDHVKQARTTQVKTTEVLADLLQAPNIAATARNNIDSINEEFFMVSSTYLDMAKKEGNTEVCRKLEEVLRVAMEEKQKTLRPEIQLLNNLMAATTVPERERVCLHARLSLHRSAVVFCCMEILSRRQA